MTPPTSDPFMFSSAVIQHPSINSFCHRKCDRWLCDRDAHGKESFLSVRLNFEQRYYKGKYYLGRHTATLLFSSIPCGSGVGRRQI